MKNYETISKNLENGTYIMLKKINRINHFCIVFPDYQGSIGLASNQEELGKPRQQFY